MLFRVTISGAERNGFQFHLLVETTREICDTGMASSGFSSLQVQTGRYLPNYYGVPMWGRTPVTCGSSFTISHVVGTVAPVAKTATYDTVKNIPWETSKCGITSNLGADHLARPSAMPRRSLKAVYWQFNRKQGYKQDDTTRTPASEWINSID